MPYADPASSKRYYLEHGEEVRARVKAYRLANPERVAESKRRWAEKNRDKLRAYYQARYEVNRETVIQRAAENYRKRLQEQPEVVRAIGRETVARRRARIRSSFVEKVKTSVVWESDGGICGICGEPADPSDWHMDHIIPIARGGPHSYKNVQVTHPLCNRRKGAS